jgi:hypothetical protein
MEASGTDFLFHSRIFNLYETPAGNFSDISFSSIVKTVLPLGEDPPAITSVCFNHNGKILAASATDGMIHMFGILVVQFSFTIFIMLTPFDLVFDISYCLREANTWLCCFYEISFGFYGCWSP